MKRKPFATAVPAEPGSTAILVGDQCPHFHMNKQKKLGYLAAVCRVTKPEAGVKRKQN